MKYCPKCQKWRNVERPRFGGNPNCPKCGAEMLVVNKTTRPPKRPKA